MTMRTTGDFVCIFLRIGFRPISKETMSVPLWDRPEESRAFAIGTSLFEAGRQERFCPSGTLVCFVAKGSGSRRWILADEMKDDDEIEG